jgi:hypothetical protein
MCLAFFLIVKWLYKYEDDVVELHGSAVDLYEKITGKKSKIPKKYVD